MTATAAIDPGGAPSGAREILLLALCQGLYLSAVAITVTVSALAAGPVAPSPAYATLPYGLLAVATAAAAVPASLLMGRVGRARVFVAGALAGAAGGVAASAALVVGSFALLCAGCALLGLFQATALYYRFAAAEAARADRRDRAISLVLAGGLLAALLGPQLGAWSRGLLGPFPFAGSFAAAAALALGAALLASRLRLPPPPPAVGRGATATGRPLREIVRRPAFAVGVLNALVGAAAMAFVMTATPLAVVACGFGVGTAAEVIRWHLVGMFAPSFVTGHLIARLGLGPVLLAGAALLLGSAGVAASGVEAWRFTLALVLLGVGWNFAYVGGTALTTRAYAPEERAKAQAAGEVLIFGGAALATVAAGAVLERAGWAALNASAVPFVLLAAASVAAWLVAGRGRAALPAPAAGR